MLQWGANVSKNDTAHSSPEMGDPEMEGAALQKIVNSLLLTLEQGQVENLLLIQISVPYPNSHKKRSFLYLWQECVL